MQLDKYKGFSVSFFIFSNFILCELVGLRWLMEQYMMNTPNCNTKSEFEHFFGTIHCLSTIANTGIQGGSSEP